jgi:class 3 adenylate cyclase
VILKKLATHNLETKNEMRKFKIRIGVNTNVDNLVTDINGKRNLSGAGINLAQRVMNAGDGNQVLVGDAVFETLRYREKYMQGFKSHQAEANHGMRPRVHQLIEPSTGLNILTPSEFKNEPRTEERLDKFVAYYFAHAIKHKDFLVAALRTPGGGQ